MSKILNATCENNVVSAEGVSVDMATILSKGKGASQGIIILDGEKAWYIPNVFGDTDSLLGNLISALGQAVDALEKAATSIQVLDNHGFLISADNGVPAVPSLATQIAQINSAASSIDSSKEALQTLKDTLK